MKLQPLLVAPLLLASCGIVPLPAVAIPDQTLTLPASSSAADRVIYDGSDVFGGSTVPGVLSNLKLRGQALYSGAGDLSSVAVYIRSSVPSCTSVPGLTVQMCDPSTESAQRIGTLNFEKGVATSFSLSGKALDAAAKAGHGYVGVQVLKGQSVFGDTLKLSNLKANAKF
ncbi:hypothetical protein [Deinococcus sp.]|uniref:hypothetical protein n=1 Tax=Deinococcus sp. TaxID=47478 RepID=UPI003B5A8AFE